MMRRLIRPDVDGVILHEMGHTYDHEWSEAQCDLSRKWTSYMDAEYDFVDVRDVARGIILACKYGKPGESYLLSGEKITVKQLLILLEKLTGVKQPSIKIPLWMAKAVGKLTPTYYRARKTKPIFTSYSAEVLFSNCNISSDKARKELGYSPRPLEKSITDAVEWFMKNPEIYKK